MHLDVALDLRDAFHYAKGYVLLFAEKKIRVQIIVAPVTSSKIGFLQFPFSISGITVSYSLPVNVGDYLLCFKVKI
jgi:hypothetical protein